MGATAPARPLRSYCQSCAAPAFPFRCPAAVSAAPEPAELDREQELGEKKTLSQVFKITFRGRGKAQLREASKEGLRHNGPRRGERHPASPWETSAGRPSKANPAMKVPPLGTNPPYAPLAPFPRGPC